jgi:hypothetical protein
MNDMRLVLQILEEKFQERLSKKTGWGRKELMIEFKLASLEALLEASNHAE